MINKTEKKISPDASPVPAKSPYIDLDYIGDPKKLLNQIITKLESWRIARVLWDPKYYETLAIYVGRQHVWYNPGTKMLEPILYENPNGAQEVLNLIIGKVVTEISRFTSFGPTAQVLAETGSSRDALAARAAKMIIQNNYYNPDLHYQAEYARCAMYDIVQGHTFLKTYWDATGGRAYQEYDMEPDMMEIMFEAEKENESFPTELDEFLNDPVAESNGDDEMKKQKDETVDNAVQSSEHATIQDLAQQGQIPGQPAQPGAQPPMPQGRSVQIPKIDDNGNPIMKRKMENGKPKLKEFGYAGCVKKKARSPLDIYYNPSASNFEDLFDLIDTSYMSVDDIKTTIPNCEDINPDDKETNNLNPWQMIYGLTVDQNPQGQTSGLLVKEYWCKASPDFPRGLRVVIVKDEIRIATHMEVLEGDRLPYSHCFYHDIGTMRGLGMVEKEMPKQKVINRLFNQYVDNASLFEVPHILTKTDTKFTEEPTNKGATRWNWSGTTEPKPWNPNAMSPAHMQLINLTSEMMDQTSHVSKLAEGQVQPNITSAEMMQTALETSAQASNMETNRFQLMVADSDYLTLRFTQAKQDKEIMIRFMGQDGRLITDCFDAAVIKGNFSMAVQPGQIGNNSRAQQGADLKSFMPVILQGQVDDPDMKRIWLQKYMDYLNFGEENRTISEMNKQQNYARSWINEIKNSYDMPNIDVTVLLQPFIDFKVWKDEIEDVLLDKDEFESWHMISRNRLMTLWHTVTNQITKMQQAAAQQVQTGQPVPGAGLPKPPAGLPGQPPKPPMPAGAPPMGAPPMGAKPPMPKASHPKISGQKPPKPSIIQTRVPSLTQPEGTQGVTQNGANT